MSPGVDLPPPEESYTFTVHLVGKAEPEYVKAADWSIVGGAYVFVDRDDREVRRIAKESVEGID